MEESLIKIIPEEQFLKQREKINNLLNKEIEIYKKMLNDSEVNFEEGIVEKKKELIKKKKGLSLKPYFQRNIISEEEIKKAKENSERTRRRIFG